jgi:fermentation-respiration switch protein FrsA (DUF1100 family)
MKMLILKLFIYLLCIFAGLLVVLYFCQSRLVFHPSRDFSAYPSDIGLRFEDVFLETEDSLKIHSWFVFTNEPKRNGVVLFCHGNAGNISDRIFSIDFFNKLGYDVFIFDYRGYGKSDGTPSEQGTYLDANAAYEYLVEKKGMPEDKIVIFGRSIGGAVAVDLAARVNPAALIVESSFTSVPDMARRIYPFLPTGLICRIKYDSLSKMKAIKCPLLVVHSPDDEMIPFEMGEKLYNASFGQKSFLKISGSHNEGHIESGDAYEDGVGNFLKQAIPSKE